ncbi:hypothetical protein KC19_8G194400 [Ceratodon purpureus]|uniref:Uncharacterized protein n=1 Tax=Ceratodon purpureus TaxID=3225 RepID=A0A8T0H063_CERPU|nr:hypothetical protein KC19_8G194400 [Ceratodon purpureus]KAG0565490.1 hypothetical protein KC19_8G194400 [Ceratodon purpureus]KAG0565491.1 hypothetical protein KC19_8G194400 [Ceratodon purpureus]
MEGADMEVGAGGLPPPPPVPEGAVPSKAPGYGGNNGAGARSGGPSQSGPNGGTSGGGNGAEPSGGTNGVKSAGAGPNGGSGSAALAALALLPKVPVPAKATRPEYGRAGRVTQLCVNYFRARLVKAEDVFHYNVSIEPPVTNKKVSRDIFKKMRETFGEAECGGKNGAYDGEKSFFTSGSLNFNTKEFPVFLDDRKGPTFRPGDRGGRPGDSPTIHSPPPGSPGDEAVIKRRRTASRGRDFVVKIEFAAKIRMRAIEDMMRGAMGRGDLEQEERALDALRVLDILLRESASERGYLLVRDNFFHKDLGEVCNLGEGVEAWRGYHSSVRPTGLGLTLNLDITMTTILKAIKVEEFLKERFNVRELQGLQGRDWVKAKNILKNVRVETTHMQVSRTHKISGFSDRAIRDLKFTKRTKDAEGNVREEEVSVEQYYFDVYSYTLKYPGLPALDVGNKKKPTFIPLELCKIVEGQRYTKSMSSKQRQAQIQACKQGPQDRQKTCENAMNVSKFGTDKLIAEFGLQFENKLAPVTGRILSAPQLEFGKGRTEEPREGRWNFNNKTFKLGVKIDPWAVAVFDSRCNDAERVASSLMESCCKRGMMMRQPAIVEKEPHNAMNYPPEQRVERMFTALRNYKPVFILAILPDKDSPIYVPFKRFCEMKIGVISQCMVKPRQLNDQYLGNLALKINLKMGGFNSPLTSRMTTVLGESTIIFGMDVSHGSPGDVNVPSIAAVVATKNWPDVFHYSTQVRTQPAKTEMIEGLYEPKGGMVRDGVSESQFQECLEVEFTAFKRACEDLQEGYNPGITFIVAQKRHNTRFFPQGNDKTQKGNCVPGTVVDKDACHPHNYDFFLVSQNGLIGTSRPTHYHVLVNENKHLKPDDIQSLTNNLCYTFGRCTTAISMAAPAAYAHVVATRYRKLVDTWGGSSEGSDTSSLKNSRGGGAARPVQALPALRMKQEHSMFFC